MNHCEYAHRRAVLERSLYLGECIANVYLWVARMLTKPFRRAP